MTANTFVLFSATDSLHRTCSEFDERSREMLQYRRLGDTLDAIGHRYGVTRERTRQIIKMAEAHIVSAADMIDENWRDRIRNFFGQSPAVAEAFLAYGSGDLDRTVGYVLLRAVGAEHPRTWAGNLTGFWSLQPHKLDELLQLLATDAPYRPGDLLLRARALSIPPEVPIEEILNGPRSPLVRASDGAWLRRRARSRDAAYLWLAEEGEPRRDDTIAAAVGGGIPAIREALRRDERFRRLRPEGTWALSEWRLADGSRYTNALDVVLEVLTERGPLTRSALFKEVARRYPVSTARIQQCFSSDRVGLTPDGRLDLVERGAKPLEEDEPRRPDNIATDPSGKVLGIKIPVDKDVIRGSGILVHSWLTWYLGLRLAPMSRVFSIEDGTGFLTVRRNTGGAQLSSLRSQVASMGLIKGCQLVVLFHLQESTVTLRHACDAANCPLRGQQHGDERSGAAPPGRV